MEIKRDRYLDKLISKEHNGLIKVYAQVWQVLSYLYAF